MASSTLSSSSSRPRGPGLRGVHSMSSLRDDRAAASSTPTFAETMQRCTYTYTPMASPSPSWNHNHQNNSDQTDVFTGLAGGITTPRRAVIRSDNNYPAALSRDLHRRRPRPISSSEISIDWSSSSEASSSSEQQIEEEEEEEDMQDRYASLEQLLARKGFKGGECRVMTPESHKLPPPSSSSSMSAHDTPRPIARPGGPPPASSVHPTPLPPSTSSIATLRTKSSILSLGGLVSSLWGSATSTTPVDATPQANVAPPSPALSGNSTTSSSSSSSSSSDDLTFEKEQTVTRWIKAAAASVEITSSSSSSSASTSSVSSSYTSTSGFARTSTDSTIESIQVETPCTSPKTAKAYIFHTARTQQDDGSMLSFEHKDADDNNAQEEGENDGQDDDEHTAESLLREQAAHNLGAAPKMVAAAAAAKEKRPSLADIFSNTSSLESIKTATNGDEDRTNSPTPPASPSTVIALPRSSSTAEVEEEVPVSPITAININICVAGPTKPQKAATRPSQSSSAAAVAPQPKLLRKAASLHSLRMAASPVLSTQDIVMARPVREATPPPPLPSVPSHLPRAPVPRTSAKSSNGSTASSASSATPRKADYPRNAAHRNPRDSPIGETRVVKGVPPSSVSWASSSPQRRGRTKGPSILDDLEDDEGLWTPPRKKTTSLRRTMHLNNNHNKINDENLSPSSPQQQQQARRPKLKAKESLECILGKQEVEMNNKLKQQVIQQTPAGRKALGQLSSFHRNPLPVPVPKKDVIATAITTENKKKEIAVQGQGQLGPGAVQTQTIGKKSSSTSSSIASLSGTIKGFFGAATGWAEPSSPPKHTSRSNTATAKPQSSHQQQRQPQSPRKSNLSSRHPSRRQIRSESIHHHHTGQIHTRGRSGDYAYSTTGGPKNGARYQGGQSRSMILPTIVISDASSEYDDGVPL